VTAYTYSICTCEMVLDVHIAWSWWPVGGCTQRAMGRESRADTRVITVWSSISLATCTSHCQVWWRPETGAARLPSTCTVTGNCRLCICSCCKADTLFTVP